MPESCHLPFKDIYPPPEENTGLDLFILNPAIVYGVEDCHDGRFSTIVALAYKSYLADLMW